MAWPCHSRKAPRWSSPSMLKRTRSRRERPLSVAIIELIDWDEGCHLRVSPAPSVAMQCVLPPASSLAAQLQDGGSPGSCRPCTLQASTEPLGAPATMSELVLSAKKALIGAGGSHVYRYRSTLCALSKAALVGGRGGPKIAKPLSVAR